MPSRRTLGIHAQSTVNLIYSHRLQLSSGRISNLHHNTVIATHARDVYKFLQLFDKQQASVIPRPVWDLLVKQRPGLVLSAHSSDPRREGGSWLRGASSPLPGGVAGQAGGSRGRSQVWALRLAPHLLLGDLLVRKQLVNVPVVLKAPGKKAGQLSTARRRQHSLRGAGHGCSPPPHSCRHGPWLGAVAGRQRPPWTRDPNSPLRKASARFQPVWSRQLRSGAGSVATGTTGSRPAGPVDLATPGLPRCCLL